MTAAARGILAAGISAFAIVTAAIFRSLFFLFSFHALSCCVPPGAPAICKGKLELKRRRLKLLWTQLSRVPRRRDACLRVTTNAKSTRRRRVGTYICGGQHQLRLSTHMPVTRCTLYIASAIRRPPRPKIGPERHHGPRLADNMRPWQSATTAQKTVAKMRPESGHGNRASERGIHSGMPPSYVPVSCPPYGPKSATTSFYASMAPLGAQFSTTIIPRIARCSSRRRGRDKTTLLEP